MARGGSERRRRPTSADVAAAAGVSRATVSYVLNDVEGQRIRPATRDRVLAAAERLGYVPHAAASALRAGRTSLVLLGLPGWPLGPPLAEAVSTLVGELERLGYTPLVHLGAPAGADGFARACERAQPVGIIAAASELPPERVAALRRNGTPAVFALAAAPLGYVPALAFDQQAVGALAIDHLAARGHRRVVAVMPEAEPLAGLGEARTAGARQAAAERGVALAVRRSDGQSVAAALDAALAAPEPPTAVYAFNDEYALAAAAWLADAGAALALIGCDDSPAARLARPPLTTIRLVDAETWRAVARQLDVMTSGAPGETLVATPALVPGATT